MLDHFSRFLHQPSPLLSGFCADLPVAVVFIADAPVLYAVGPGMAVFAAPFGVAALPLQVAVFHPVAHFL